jgi:hypothetical protein
MTSPILDLEDALYATLNVSSATSIGTGVFNRIAPENQLLPYLVYQWQGGGDENLTPHRSRNPVYYIKGIAETLGEAGALDAAADALLHQKPITISTGGWTCFWLARESDNAYMEIDTLGRRIYHSGGIYRIWFDK